MYFSNESKGWSPLKIKIPYFHSMEFICYFNALCVGYLFVNALLIATRKTSFSSTKEPPEEKTRRRGSTTEPLWKSNLTFVQKPLQWT